MVFFYDTDGSRKPTPLTDEEYTQRVAYHKKVIAEKKRRIRQAFSTRKAREIESAFDAFAARDTMTDLSFNDWKITLDLLTDFYGESALIAQIKFTGKKYRPNGWSKEELEQKLDILKLDEQSRSHVYKAAGYDCCSNTSS